MKNTLIKTTCVQCDEAVEVTVPTESWIRYQTDPHRPKIQELFPALTPAERELFISGICGKCWNEMFPVEQEVPS